MRLDPCVGGFAIVPLLFVLVACDADNDDAGGLGGSPSEALQSYCEYSAPCEYRSFCEGDRPPTGDAAAAIRACIREFAPPDSGGVCDSAYVALLGCYMTNKASGCREIEDGDCTWYSPFTDDVEDNCQEKERLYNECELLRGLRCSGRLVPWSSVCDGVPDCPDSAFADEDDDLCDGFRCSNGVYVESESVCDGYNDCGDNTDESNCGGPDAGGADAGGPDAGGADAGGADAGGPDAGGPDAGGPDGDNDGSGQGGCELDDDCAGYKCHAGTCTDNCSAQSDCAIGFECAGAVCQPSPTWRYVAIVSASPEKAAPNPGPDIDGVVVTRGRAAQPVSAIAKAVAGEQDAGNTMASSASALVADAKKADGSCDLSDAAATYYSMGSNGSPTGFLILDMGVTFAFATGDQIKVIELAKTNCNNISTDRSDGYKVFLCESADAATAADIEARCLSLGASSPDGGEFTSTVQ